MKFVSLQSYKQILKQILKRKQFSVITNMKQATIFDFSIAQNINRTI